MKILRLRSRPSTISLWRCSCKILHISLIFRTPIYVKAEYFPGLFRSLRASKLCRIYAKIKAPAAQTRCAQTYTAGALTQISCRARSLKLLQMSLGSIPLFSYMGCVKILPATRHATGIIFLPRSWAKLHLPVTADSIKIILSVNLRVLMALLHCTRFMCIIQKPERKPLSPRVPPHIHWAENIFIMLTRVEILIKVPSAIQWSAITWLPEKPVPSQAILKHILLKRLHRLICTIRTIHMQSITAVTWKPGM